MVMGHSDDKTNRPGAGFRYSPYGMPYDPGAAYWARVGLEMAQRLPQSVPEVIWIVSVLEGQGTHLTFPGECPEPYITFSTQDLNQAALEQFDRLGFRVWLQVEPGEARVETLIDLVLDRYKTHPCLVGVGVDVEWHHSTTNPEGVPVTDAEAAVWLAAARAHDPSYRLFLKHWEAARLPPTLREGLLFVDDSQMFASLEEMLAEFTAWGRHFSPARVAFQIGYPADKKWWGRISDPAMEIGKSIIESIPNARGIYWVNFSALEVFPP